MNLPIEHDRAAQLLMAHDHGADADQARARLESAQLVLTADASLCATPGGQAAMLSVAACATRMFRGGVFVSDVPATPVLIGARPGVPLRRAMLLAGCRDTNVPDSAFHLHVGQQPPRRPHFYTMATGWLALAGPAPAEPGEPNVVGGALAGALGVSEAFRRVVLDDLLACRRPLMLSAWDPSEPEAGAAMSRLPTALWLLGLGNLGQALMLLLSFLPFPDRHDAMLLLQDKDVVGEENRLSQLLTTSPWVGKRKARAVADFADALGFQTTVCERPFGALTRVDDGDPRIALVGVDNLDARRFAANAGFELVLDTGLGRSASEIFDIRLHGFPGRFTPERAWPTALPQVEEVPLNPGLQKLVAEGRLPLCGALTIAGQSLGVPSTALAAAALQVGQLCRALSRGAYCDFIDVPLSNPGAVAATSRSVPNDVSLPMMLVG